MKQTVSDLFRKYTGFYRSERSRRIGDVLNVVAMALLAAAFVPVEPLISALAVLVGSFSAIRLVSSRGEDYVNRNLKVVVAGLVVVGLVAFGFVFDVW